MKKRLSELFHVTLRTTLNRIAPRLAGRSTIITSRRTDWWGLMRARGWSLSDRPRILTKFFGAEGAFVGDYDVKFYAVMGHVWTLKSPTTDDHSHNSDANESGPEQLSERDILAAFVALCNSSIFAKLLGLYAPHVAGGQFDLSARPRYPNSGAGPSIART